MHIMRQLSRIRNKLLGLGAISRQTASVEADLRDLKSLISNLELSTQHYFEDLLDKIAANSGDLSVTRANSERARDALDVFGGRIERSISSHYLSHQDQIRFRDFARQFTPSAPKGASKVRIGRSGDGGYVMVDAFDDVTTAFSCGVGKEASWDLAIASKGIEVHQFDHTISTAPIVHPKIRYHNAQVSHEPGPNKITVDQMVSMQAAKSGGALLKVDIEHDEWTVFAHVNPDLLTYFSQIVVEFHTVWRAYDADWFATAQLAVNNIKKHFEVVHVHGNNAASFVNIANIVFPELIEVTFLNRKNAVFTPSDEIFPTELDAPNDPLIADLHLGTFRF